MTKKQETILDKKIRVLMERNKDRSEALRKILQFIDSKKQPVKRGK